jgi:NADPH-dependent curcumin reductase CurA
VVGVVGGPEKCAWLVDELEFDAAVDYKTGNLGGQLRAACPEQVDLYFDNVAGDVLDAALRVMNRSGHVICCRMVSTCDSEKPRAGSTQLPGILMARRLRMTGFILLDHLATRARGESLASRGALGVLCGHRTGARAPSEGPIPAPGRWPPRQDGGPCRLGRAKVSRFS